MIKKFIRQLKNEQKGFTLMELIIVLVIIALLAAIAIPVYLNISEKAKATSDQATAQTIETTVEVYAASEGKYPEATTFDDLVSELCTKGYLKQSEFEPSQDKKVFVYDAEKHTIKTEDASSAVD